MNPYIVPVTCSICGGPGVGDVRRGWAQDWFCEVVHKDPAVCRYYIEKQKQQKKVNREDEVVY